MDATPAAPPSALLSNLLVFGRLLRSLGLEVHMGRMLDVADALPHVDLGERDDVYHTCRALLVHRHEDLSTFDRAFDAFWRGRGATALVSPRSPADAPPPAAPAGAAAGMEVVGDAGEGEEDGGALRTWSDAAILAKKDFAEFTADEIAVARIALDRLQWDP